MYVQVCSGHLLAIARQHYQRVNVLKYTDDGTYLLSGGADARVLVWKFNRLVKPSYMNISDINGVAEHATLLWVWGIRW